MTKYVYTFNEVNKSFKNIVGGKGANLGEMVNMGLPVPNGFIVSTEACIKYYRDNNKISEEVETEIYNKLKELEKLTGKTVGDPSNPLLISVRSGARVSMPGMMDTILNLGLNDEIVTEVSKLNSNPRFIYDSYRRFIQMFSDVVMGLPREEFEKVLDNIKNKKGIKIDTELTIEDLKEVISEYKNIYFKYINQEFPSDFKIQLIESIKAVFRSWNNDRAKTYRKLHNIPDGWGTAVNVQEMVYGNKGDTSGTGVVFSRNPATGENKLYGEYLMNAQGEDVVAGIRTPHQIETLKEIMPNCYTELLNITKLLEKYYKDMQDIEFTIEEGKFYILQTRSGKRTAKAALKIALDMVDEGLITKEEALLRVEPNQLEQLLHPTFDETINNKEVIATGLAASPGAATGKIYFNAKDILTAKNNGEKELILVRLETSPEDIDGMVSANGVLTVRGGMTSHAAVVARGMGKCAITGCSSIVIDEFNKTLTTGSKIFKEGDYLSIDGTTGNVYGERIEPSSAKITDDFAKFMAWADEVRTLGIRVNADNEKDAQTALKYGAEGIGLCRTEHMFWGEDRIASMRHMIVASNKEERQAALNKLLLMQREDFVKLFKVMDSKPITIRYLDPPLHEFLPHEESDINELSSYFNITNAEIKNRIEGLKEQNPMMGHRGCRIIITYPEICIMQTRAIIEAAIIVSREGIKVEPELMIPLIGDIRELRYIKNIIIETADNLIKLANINLTYKVGTMIEVPRATIISDQIAKEVDFFSYGTNDLTQMTYGFSRDDAAKFLKDYYDKNIFTFDPFKTIDRYGVGELLKVATKMGKDNNPNLKLGICGEHGGDPASIEFCYEIGLSYVSCSPFRVPIARLAAAQAKLRRSD
ncbi:MAG: pyruvate, phosphate dikinase [Bacilli bacterium]|nr:pyruvate, phosphate dikinase [Bacilli bacterium]